MRTVLLDLDGTLFDSREVVVLATQRAAEGLDMPVPPAERVISLVGTPEFYAALAPPDRAAALRARACQHEIELLRAGMGGLFPHARETLEGLRGRGALLGIVTNSSRGYTDAIVETHGLDRLVHLVFCADDRPGAGKAALVEASLKELQKPACLAGDRRGDLEAGRAHGLATVGCLWGYGSTQELADANRIAGDWAELGSILDEWMAG